MPGWVHVQGGGDNEGPVISIGPGCGGRTCHPSVQAQALEGRLAHDVQNGVQGNALQLRRHLAIHRNDGRSGSERANGLPVARSSRYADASWLNNRCAGVREQPVFQHHRALQLPALLQARDN